MALRLCTVQSLLYCIVMYWTVLHGIDRADKESFSHILFSRAQQGVNFRFFPFLKRWSWISESITFIIESPNICDKLFVIVNRKKWQFKKWNTAKSKYWILYLRIFFNAIQDIERDLRKMKSLDKKHSLDSPPATFFYYFDIQRPDSWLFQFNW